MNPLFLDEQLKRQEEQRQAAGVAELETRENERTRIVATEVAKVVPLLIQFLKNHQATVQVANMTKPVTSVNTPDVKQVVNAVESLKEALAPVPQDNSDVVAALEELGTSVNGKLDSLKSPDKLEVNDLKKFKQEMNINLGKILQAIKSQEIKPEVNVAPADVHVDPTDTKPIIKALKDVQSEVKKKPVPELKVEKPDMSGVVKAIKDVKKAVDDKPVPGTPIIANDPLVRYVPSDIDDASAVQYFGFVNDSGGWYIRQFDTGASPKTIRFTFGNSNYATNFTNRSSLTYTTWGS